MSNFKPRLNADGIWQNPYWYSQSPFYPSYQMPNCTCYAWGRFWEITGERPKLPTSDAGTWYDKVVASGSYQCSKTTPVLGAIAVWAREGYAGHVGVVEKINADGSFVISNSNYSRPLTNYPPSMKDYFFLSNCTAQGQPDWLGQSFKLKGYIYPNRISSLPAWMIIKLLKGRKKL